MHQHWGYETGSNSRPRAPLLPTPEASRKSEDPSDSASTGSAYSGGPPVPTNSYPPIASEQPFERSRPQLQRRDSQYPDVLNSPTYREVEQNRQSLPSLRSVLENNPSSSPQTPMQPSPCEPSFTHSTFKPPSLYPSRNARLEANIETSSSASTRSSPSSPGIASGPALTTLSWANSAPEPLQSVPRANEAPYPHNLPSSLGSNHHHHHHQQHQQQQQQQPHTVHSRTMAPPSLHQSRSDSFPLPQHPARRNFTTNDYDHPFVSRAHHQSLYHDHHYHPYSFSDRMEMRRHYVRQLPLPSPGFVQSPFDEHYGQSPYALPSIEGGGMLNAVPVHDYPWPIGGKPRKRSNLPKQSTEVMKHWFDRNLHNPYPTEEQKAHFSKATGISMTQVSNWFINHRRRCPELREKREQPTHHWSQNAEL